MCNKSLLHYLNANFSTCTKTLHPNLKNFITKSGVHKTTLCSTNLAMWQSPHWTMLNIKEGETTGCVTCKALFPRTIHKYGKCLCDLNFFWRISTAIYWNNFKLKWSLDPPHPEHQPMELCIPSRLMSATPVTLKIHPPILVIILKWPTYPHFQS